MIQYIDKPRLAWIRLIVDMEGKAWEGFTAERTETTLFSPSDWPGKRKALAAMLDWPDCRRETVRPFYGQMHWHLTNDHGHHQTIVRELEFPC